MITKRIILKKRKQHKPFLLSDDQMALIMPVGDIHWGSKNFPEKRFVKHLEWGMERGAYFIGMGDYMEFAPHSQRMIMKQLRDSSKEQIDDMVKYDAEQFVKAVSFTKGAWLGIIKGNHSWMFDDGKSIEQYLCSQLGCDYLGDMAMLRVIPEESPTKHHDADTIIVAHHGKGGGQTIGGQLSKPEHMLKWLMADIILMGHSHAKLAAPIDKITITPDGVTSHRTTIVARTGSFFKAYEGKEPEDIEKPAYLSSGSYVERMALMPSSLGGICFSIGVSKIEGSKYYKPSIHFSI